MTIPYKVAIKNLIYEFIESCIKEYNLQNCGYRLTHSSRYRVYIPTKEEENKTFYFNLNDYFDRRLEFIQESAPWSECGDQKLKYLKLNTEERPLWRFDLFVLECMLSYFEENLVELK